MKSDGSKHNHRKHSQPNGRTGAPAARPRAAAPDRTGRAGMVLSIFAYLPMDLCWVLKNV